MKKSLLYLLVAIILSACGSSPLAQPEGTVSVEQAETASPTVENIKNTPIITLIPTIITNETTEATIDATPVPTATPKQAETIDKETVTATSASPVRVGKYGFSQPKQIFKGQAVQVIEWLPDSEHLLITHPNIDGEGRQLIELVDLDGQQVISFGAWYVSPHAPVVFSPIEETITFTGYDNENPDLPGIMVVSKDSSATIISEETEYFGALSDGTHFWAVDTQGNILTAPSSSVLLQEQMTTSALSLTQGNAVNKEQAKNSGTPLSIVVNPVNPDQAIIYNNLAFLVADLNTGQLTEIDLGEEYSQRASGKYWALKAKWSPDGRQIATKTTVGQPPITGFSNFTILNTTTWTYRRVEEPDIFSDGMTWLPNSTDMLIRVDNNSISGWGVGDIHLFDVELLESQPLPIFSENLVHSSGANILVSPDGQKFITSCVLLSEVNFNDPSKTTRQTCLVDILVHP